MTSFYKYLILCYGLYLLYSCGNSLYNPINEVAVSPSKKGDLYTNVGILHMQQSLPQVSLSYSPVNRIGLAYNGVYGKNYLYNTILLGSYHSFLKPSKSGKIKVEKQKSYLDCYVGFGVGQSNLIRFNNREGISSIRAHSIFKKLITQAAYHYHRNSFGFDFGVRYGKLDFTRLTIHSNETEEYQFFLEQDPFDLMESHLNLNFGKESFKIMVGVNYRQQLIDGSNLFGWELKPENFNRLNIFSGVAVKFNEIKHWSLKKKKRR